MNGVEMKAVLLAAGKGTRLRPLTDEMPKVMIPINGKPVLEYHIEQLARAGIKDIIINLHYLPDSIRNYFLDGSKWATRIHYSYEPEILGTAGAIKKLEAELEDDAFLVVYGDNFLEITYRDFVAFSESKTGIGTVVVIEKDNVLGSGILDIEEGDRVLRFIEKPDPSGVISHWVNAGVYYFSNCIFNYIEPGYSDFGYDVLPRILKAGETLTAYKLKNEVWAIDDVDLLKKIKNRLKYNKPLSVN